MPDGEQHVAFIDGARDRREPVGVGLSVAPCKDLGLVVAQLDRIMALADAGRLHEGREACADLMFEFQPLLVARLELLQRLGAALRRCEADQLLRRLAIAVRGEAA